MKSAERHKLETNWLAIHLDEWIERIRPYTSTITGVIIAAVIVTLVWWYFSRTSASRQTEAWNAFNNVVGGNMDDQSVTQLGKSAEEFSDTDMYPWARLTWADGQVWTASRTILQNRTGAMKALDDAAGAYQSILGSTHDAQLTDRARYGLARVFEMRNEPDKAREEYEKVVKENGAFAIIAKRRAEDLGQEKTKKTLDWLATAEAPNFTAPRGPGTPGVRPGLDVEDLKMPGASGLMDPSKGDLNLEELLKTLGTGDTSDRYKTDEMPKTGEGAAKVDEPAKTGGEKPATDEKKPESSETPKPGTGK